MALTPRYTSQMPFVGTPEQRACVDAEADERSISVSQVIRDAIDARYGLVDGRHPATEPATVPY